MEGIEEPLEVVQVPELREKDFGSEEGKRFGTRGKQDAATVSSAATWVAPESQESMRIRIERFVDAFFVPTVREAASDPNLGLVVIIAHGIILNVLLRTLLTRFGPDEMAKLAKPGDAPWRSEWLASWSNTGYLEAELRVATTVVVLGPSTSVGDPDASHGIAAVKGPVLTAPSKVVAVTEHDTDLPAPVTGDIQLVVRAVNCVEHLSGLKKTKGGLGSVGHDEKQRTVDSFFSRPAKKPKHEQRGG